MRAVMFKRTPFPLEVSWLQRREDIGKPCGSCASDVSVRRGWFERREGSLYVGGPRRSVTRL